MASFRAIAAATGAVLTVLAVAPAAAQRAPAMSSKGCEGFLGRWDTNFGPMQIGAAPNGVVGTYQWQGPAGRRSDTLSGKVNGRVLSGSFFQPGYPVASKTRGELRFELSPDGNSFRGTWVYTDGEKGEWIGLCLGK